MIEIEISNLKIFIKIDFINDNYVNLLKKNLILIIIFCFIKVVFFLYKRENKCFYWIKEGIWKWRYMRERFQKEEIFYLYNI